MAGEIRTTIIGNLTGDPELRFTASGDAVVSFVVAVNPRRWDATANEWTDTEPSFLRCSAWRRLAENIAETLRKGDRAIVTGVMAERRWQDKDTDQPRSAWGLTVEAAGPDLAWATATVKRARRESVPPDDEWATASRERPEPADPGKPVEGNGSGRPRARTRAKGSAQG